VKVSAVAAHLIRCLKGCSLITFCLVRELILSYSCFVFHTNNGISGKAKQSIHQFLFARDFFLVVYIKNNSYFDFENGHTIGFERTTKLYISKSSVHVTHTDKFLPAIIDALFIVSFLVEIRKVLSKATN
jgi:hypothetical protein